MTNEKNYIKTLFYVFYIYLAIELFLIWLSFYITDPGMGDLPSGSYLNLFTLLGTVPLSVLMADLHPYIYTDSNIFGLMTTVSLSVSIGSVIVLFTKNVTHIKYIVYFYAVLLANRGMGITLFGVPESAMFAFLIETPNFLGNLFFYLRLKNK